LSENTEKKINQKRKIWGLMIQISKFINPTEIIFPLYSGQGEMNHQRIKRSKWRV